MSSNEDVLNVLNVWARMESPLQFPKYSQSSFRLQLHGAIYRPDSFVLMLRYCANLKAIRYESTSLNRIVADKSHRVIVALGYDYTVRFIAPILLY